MATTKKLKLPKALLEMKFMLKTKERLKKEENQKDCDRLYSNIITNEMRHASEKNIFESSFTFCEDLIEGRVSFKGMNPEIERLMELENKPNACDGDMQKDVSDEALAKNMNKLFKRKGSSGFKDCVPNKKKKN
ncbi:M-phase phosphoprotein 6 [Bicyclus anynana]|uniref:M-phase phosphoprotein 6 n=1 Tax=Bicyclus anynana TaxID=110368 RepID=A0ABM3M6H5_BICAN|nr:M-phase phosphoprotein 6 [Bicyclus anynana]